MDELQEGIYYKEGQRPGSSFCIVFLDIKGSPDATSIGNEITQLWDTYRELKNSVAKDISYKDQVTDSIDPSILIGYGSKIFSVPNIQKERPVDFSEKYGFKVVSSGGSIFENSSLLYREGITEDPVSSSYVLLQFISKSETITKLGWTRTWEFLNNYLKEHNKEGLYIRKFYTGYNRPDNRSWLGFYDGISNIPSAEREAVISINQTNLCIKDLWTLKGTYMAFVRMNIDLEQWQKTEEKIQERVIGRSKETGCPIIGVTDGENIPIAGCPIYNTDNVTQYGNEIFRSGSNKYQAGLYGYETQPLEYSHMNQMISGFDHLDSKGEPSKIYRQGYEFLDSVDEYPYFSVGLNFISFQNNPEKIHNLFRYGFTKNHPDKYNSDLRLSDFLSVESAGFFLIPPAADDNKFPGYMLFPS